MFNTGFLKDVSSVCGWVTLEMQSPLRRTGREQSQLVPLMQPVHIPRGFALSREKAHAAREWGTCKSFSDKPERL